MAEKTQNHPRSSAAQAHAPRSADDWETLFEAPKIGLIAVIEEARSLAALDRGTRSTLKKLLVHKDERPQLKGYERQLAAIIARHDEAGDIEQTRQDVIALLRQLKEDGKRAAAEHAEPPAAPKPNRQAAGMRAGRTSALMKRGIRFSQVNKIGVIVLSTLLLAAAAVLAVYLQKPEMPAQERRAVASLLLAHGHSVRPDISWEIEDADPSDDDKFELVFQLGNEKHVQLIRSFNAMKRAKFAASLCPGGGELVDRLAAYQRQFSIVIKAGGKTLTSASCS